MIYIYTNSSEGFKITSEFELKMMGKSQAKNNVKKKRKDEDSHLQARRDDDGVEEDQRWAPEMKNKQEQARRTNASSSNNNGDSRHRFKAAVAYKPDPLAPIQGTNPV